MKKEKIRNTCDNVFTKDTTIGEVISTNSDLTKILEGFGLHCLGLSLIHI